MDDEYDDGGDSQNRKTYNHHRKYVAHLYMYHHYEIKKQDSDKMCEVQKNVQRLRTKL